MSTATDTLLEVPAELNAALETVRENRVRLEKLMTLKPGFEQKHATAAASIANAIKVLSTEARLWADQLTARAARATSEQRTEASIKHLAQLPPGPRMQAYVALCAAEARNLQPISISVAGE